MPIVLLGWSLPGELGNMTSQQLTVLAVLVGFIWLLAVVPLKALISWLISVALVGLPVATAVKLLILVSPAPRLAAAMAAHHAFQEPRSRRRRSPHLGSGIRHHTHRSGYASRVHWYQSCGYCGGDRNDNPDRGPSY